ncbi:tetratricopeptide repeat protein, partial [Pseudofrankia asymbiotica]|uniref:tetratricopeptide repeat protein n=1 Tax=Pseudofrankia asymbiotica TaxID=1834516 RepID=UPI001F5199C4
MVVDYAETHGDFLDRLLGVLGDRASRRPVRLLLVARTAGDWWTDLSRRYDLADGAEVVALAPVDVTVAGRREAFAEAVEALAARLHEVDSTVDWEARAAAVVGPRLDPDAFGQVLAVHVAALVALLDVDRPPDSSAGAESWDRVADRLLRHEEGYWIRAAHGRGIDRASSTLADGVLAATLCGAASHQDALATLARLPGFAGTDGLAHDARDQAVRWLADLYPPPPDRPASRWGGVVPDRIAEHFVARTVEQREGASRIEQLLDGASAGQIHQAFTVLTRASAARRDLADLVYRLVVDDPVSRAVPAVRVAVETPTPTELLRALATVADQLDADQLGAVIDELPRYSTRLLDLAVDLQQAYVSRLREADSSDDALSGLASSLNNLSVRLREMGRWEDGLAVIEEAVSVYRRLAAVQPDTFLPDLAMSLNNLSTGLGELGRWEDGLGSIEEAIGIYRRLAEMQPDAFLHRLATVLSTLSVQLGELGRWEDSLAASEEAVGVYRGLVDVRSDDFRDDLAMALNNLSVQLGELGQREDGLAASEEAVSAYRQLADVQPDAFLPDLARSLSNLSVRLGELGRWKDGLAAIEESVGVYRRLVKENPDVFLPALGTSLNNLSIQMKEQGRREDGLVASEEAVDVYRRLVEVRPDVFLPDLAGSLNNLSIRLGGLGRREDGLTAIEEALAIRRRLAEVRPDVFLPDLAGSLINL